MLLQLLANTVPVDSVLFEPSMKDEELIPVPLLCIASFWTISLIDLNALQVTSKCRGLSLHQPVNKTLTD